MNEATLKLKDGQTLTVCEPSNRDLHDLLHYMRVPADAAGRTLRLQVPDGTVRAIPAGEIESLEVPPPYVLVSDFMTEAEMAQVQAFTLTHAAAFENSGVHEVPNEGASPTGYRIRRSRVLEGPANGAMAAIVFPKLQALMPKLWSQLGAVPFALNAVECQVTAHGDGDFFAVHTDNGMPEIAHRRISYVYYFHRDPKQFSGGQLVLFNTLFKDGYAQCGSIGVAIDPPRNGLMVFPTFVYHEVSPIHCASAALTDQRLTLNGWLF